MEGDKVIILDYHKRKARKIFRILLKNLSKFRNQKIIIDVYGPSGSGKTEAGEVLRELFFSKGLRVRLLHLDDYYISMPNERESIRKSTDIIGPNEINWSLVNQDIHDFRTNSMQASLRRINKYSGVLEYVQYNPRFFDILIVEGLYSAKIDSKYKFYLTISDKKADWFRKLRKKENEYSEFRKYVVRREKEEILKLKELADYII